MTQRVPRDMLMRDKIKKLTPSEDNPICECVADLQCPYCVIAELYTRNTKDEETTIKQPSGCDSSGWPDIVGERDR